MQPYVDFNTNERAVVKIDFSEDLPKSKRCSFCGSTMAYATNKLKIDFNKKDDDRKFVKVQSKLIFDVVHKPYDKIDIYTFN